MSRPTAEVTDDRQARESASQPVREAAADHAHDAGADEKYLRGLELDGRCKPFDPVDWADGLDD